MLPLCRKGWGCTDLAAGYHPLTGLQLGRVFLGKAVSPHRAVQMATVCPQCPGGGGGFHVLSGNSQENCSTQDDD